MGLLITKSDLSVQAPSETSIQGGELHIKVWFDWLVSWLVGWLFGWLVGRLVG